jgi:hypothetical protein
LVFSKRETGERGTTIVPLYLTYRALHANAQIDHQIPELIGAKLVIDRPLLERNIQLLFRNFLLEARQFLGRGPTGDNVDYSHEHDVLISKTNTKNPTWLSVVAPMPTTRITTYASNKQVSKFTLGKLQASWQHHFHHSDEKDSLRTKTRIQHGNLPATR